MRIFISGTSFETSYGGPAWSVSSLAHHLADLGVSVGLWAPDGSAISSPVIRPHDGLLLLSGPLRNALSDFGRPDLFHDNGMWLPHNHSVAVAARSSDLPRVVSLRGMLDPKAMAFRKWKKRAAWLAYQKRDLDHADALHATAAAEVTHARGLGLRPTVFEIPNGVSIPEWPPKRPSEEITRVRTVLFLGRIHPIKGLPVFIEAWARVRPENWRLMIAGPDECRHLSELRDLSRSLNLKSGDVAFVGPVNGDDKEACFASADVVVVPSQSENFGMVVAEALARERPVLTTTGTPWQLLEEERCGWWVPAAVDTFADAIECMTGLDDNARAEMGRRGRATMQARFTWRAIALRFVDAYRAILQGDAGVTSERCDPQRSATDRSATQKLASDPS